MNRQMTIGILSDPHTRSDFQKEAIGKLLSEGAEYLIHAGDLCAEENLKQLKETGLPYAAVFGNNDTSLHSVSHRYNIRPEPWYLQIRDIRIKLMHRPHYMTPDADLVIYGHTHRFSIESHLHTLYLNPGEICAREGVFSECVLLSLQPGQWKIKHLFRRPPALSWESETSFLHFRHSCRDNPSGNL